MSMDERIKKLNEYLVGWSGYFWIAQAKGPFEELDKWIRARLRKCLLKQWKASQTIRRKLRNLGLTEDWANMIAFSRKGLWRLAHSHQIHTALDIAYTGNNKGGKVCLKDIVNCALHYEPPYIERYVRWCGGTEG